MPMISAQGNIANTQGKTLEKSIIEPLIKSKGFQCVSYKDYKKYPSKYGGELLLKDVPFTTIYNHQGRTEYKIISKKHNIEVRVECKWQQSSGSVDEKFPYTYLNCVEAMPERDIIIVYGGKGAKPGAIEWLKNAVNEKKYYNQNIVKRILKL